MRTNSLWKCLALALAILTSGCRDKTSHIVLTPLGKPIQVVSNGDVIEWDIGDIGYIDYRITFADPGPCGKQLIYTGTPGHPARCTVQGQPDGGLSTYRYSTCISFKNDPCPALKPLGPYMNELILTGRGCDGCQPVAAVSGIDNGSVYHSEGKTNFRSAGNSTNLTRSDSTDLLYKCSNNLTTVSPHNPHYQGGTTIEWLSDGAYTDPTIIFPPNGSPCAAPPTKDNGFVCTLGHTAASYTYRIRAGACVEDATPTITIDPPPQPPPLGSVGPH